MNKFLKQIVFGLFFFVLINLIILAIYEYPAYKAIKNKTHKNYLKWNDIHTNKNAYDLIVLGSSRAYTAYNPEMIDDELNIKSYNMGTSAQDIAESYYSLKEILEYQNPKYVILDLFFQSSDDTHNYYQIISNMSFFNSFDNKYDLLIDGFGEKGVLNYSLPLLKFNNYIKQDLIALFSKKEEKQINLKWIRGFQYDTTVVTKKKIKNFEPISNFKNTSFNKERFYKYFEKINTLIKSHNIKLICVRAPYPPSRLKLSNNKDAENFYKDFMDNKKIHYYDLNTFQKTKYKHNDLNFSDFHHANHKGSQIATKQLVEIIKNNN